MKSARLTFVRLCILIFLLLAACHGADAERAEPSLPDVRADAEGFLLSYFDEDGVHTATRRSEVPDTNREHVRTQLQSSPQRAPAGSVYVADLRKAGPDGAYPVVIMERSRLEALIDRATGAEVNDNDKAAAGQVILYGASWCGACRSAIAFLNKRGVDFTEIDIEKDSSARAEMNRKLKAAGRAGSGIPVIDVRGRILTGFSPKALSAAIDSGTKL